MDGFKHTLAAMPVGQIRRYFGTAHFDGSRWFANIHGSLLDARWGDSVMPLQGGVIAVDVMKDAAGLASALVSTGYRDQPRPATGTILSQGVSDVVFTGADGGSYATDWFIGSYSPGDLVLLSWAGDKPAVIGIIGQITQPPPVDLPPPDPGVSNGQTALITSASDTWSSNGWGAWAASRNGGEFVYTGTQSGMTVTGSWFYGAAKPELAGKTITRVQFKVPARLSGVGSYNSPVTIYVYAHNSGSRPGSDVSRIAGPQPIGIDPGSAGGYVDLDPAVFGPHLQAGGGISIAGGSYAGFNSRLKDPEAGKLLIDWTT